MSAQLLELVGRLGRPRVGVVGDLMLDQYVWGDVERISPEAPIPVLRVTRREVRVGGAGSVAVNLAKLGCDVSVFSILGGDRDGGRVAEILEGDGCDLRGVERDGSRPTTVKTRHMGYVQQSHRAVQQMLRVDEEELGAIEESTIMRILEGIDAQKGELQAVLLSDYRKGLISPALVEGIREIVGDTPILADPARMEDYSLYRGASLICPNRFEAELASGISCRSIEGCHDAADRLLEDLDLKSVAITLDRDGIFLALRGGEYEHFPTRARVVADVTGAGDMVLTVLGAAAAAGASPQDAVRLANVAAGLEVRHFGVTPISRAELAQELRFQGHPVVGKIKTEKELVPLVEEAKRSGKSVVFTNGCFDLLHPGHHHLLNGASREGDILIVAVNSDASIRRLKGEHRPRIGEEDRVKMLAGMEAVDFVTLFETDTPNHLLESLHPDVLVKGGEYREGVVVGREIVEDAGGRIAYIDQMDGFSTTKLLGEAGEEPEN